MFIKCGYPLWRMCKTIDQLFNLFCFTFSDAYTLSSLIIFFIEPISFIYIFLICFVHLSFYQIMWLNNYSGIFISNALIRLIINVFLNFNQQTKYLFVLNIQIKNDPIFEVILFCCYIFKLFRFYFINRMISYSSILFSNAYIKAN